MSATGSSVAGHEEDAERKISMGDQFGRKAYFSHLFGCSPCRLELDVVEGKCIYSVLEAYRVQKKGLEACHASPEVAAWRRSWRITLKAPSRQPKR